VAPGYLPSTIQGFPSNQSPDLEMSTRAKPAPMSDPARVETSEAPAKTAMAGPASPPSDQCEPRAFD
jgi:hypothetical protein